MDDRRIYDAYIAGRRSAALAAGVRIGLFDLLDETPLGEDEIAERFELRPRGVRALCRALLAMGLLERHGERLRPAPDARAYLVRGRPEWLGGLIELEIENPMTPERVIEGLRSDGPSVYDGQDPWERHARDPEAAARFTRAMHSISQRPARALAAVVDLGAATSLLDVGAGAGTLSIALARAWPRLRCTCWDLATVCAVARECVAEAGLAERVDTLEGDFVRDPFPAPVDVVLLSQILHDWPPDRCRDLVLRAFDALAPGGCLLVHEKLAGRSEPVANALVDLDMLVWTEGQQWEESSLRELLEGAGFTGFERRATTGYWSVVLARRAG